jgi:hypothetical protein
MIDRDDHNWYQDAIIYQLHVKEALNKLQFEIRGGIL